ncbi:helix-turn-helix transcriptional regulator [Candidatus Bipolaricaulota bacterium]|nr:helix-turn-helix transcriptional regulator [Candidatus Bipolaricaulota bacterium]MBS3813015.1 helix-turn-helix transcriptional regulator [Candidatus Bipolaricaulota bacterium]
MSTIRKRFAARLKELREERGISRQELCRKAGFHRTYIGKIERGEKSPSLEAIEIIAEELDVSIVKLFDFNNKIDEESK